MAGERILITVCGMGDAAPKSTFDWAAALLPGGTLTTVDGTDAIVEAGQTTFLFELFYEDLNEAILGKFAEAIAFTSRLPAEVRKAVNTRLGDVVGQALSADALNAAQMRFISTYNLAVACAQEIVGSAGNVRTVPLGVLSHSLGTFVTYEGLCRAADAKDAIVTPLRTRVVMCAPMLAPFTAALKKAGLTQRYLVVNGANKPRRTFADGTARPFIESCTCLYDRRDPFFLINPQSFYKQGPASDLVDQLEVFGSKTPLLKFWEAHGMTENYVPLKRELIVGALFPPVIA